MHQFILSHSDIVILKHHFHAFNYLLMWTLMLLFHCIHDLTSVLGESRVCQSQWGRATLCTSLCYECMFAVKNDLFYCCSPLLNHGSTLMWFTDRHTPLFTNVNDSTEKTPTDVLGILLKSQRGNIMTTNVFSCRKNIQLQALCGYGSWEASIWGKENTHVSAIWFHPKRLDVGSQCHGNSLVVGIFPFAPVSLTTGGVQTPSINLNRLHRVCWCVTSGNVDLCRGHRRWIRRPVVKAQTQRFTTAPENLFQTDM